MQRPPLLRSRRRAASLSEHHLVTRAHMHPFAVRFAPLAGRLTRPAPASPSIARHAAALSGHRAPARSRLHSLASLFQARCARFTCRETSAPFAWNIRVLVCYSVLLAASKNPDLVTNLVNSNFLYRAAENTKAAEVAAGEHFRLAGPTGLEPATSGVTGRGSRVSREKSFYIMWIKSFECSYLRACLRDLVRNLVRFQSRTRLHVSSVEHSVFAHVLDDPGGCIMVFDGPTEEVDRLDARQRHVCRGEQRGQLAGRALRLPPLVAQQQLLADIELDEAGVRHHAAQRKIAGRFLQRVDPPSNRPRAPR